MQAAPAPPSASVQQHRTFLTDLPKVLLGFEKPNIFILIFLFFKTLFPPSPNSPKKFQAWHCARDKWTAGEIGDLQHSLLSVHERGALFIQLCVLKKDFSALPVLLLSFGEQRERQKRAVGK